MTQRILLVEDDRDAAEAFCVLLESWGFQVDMAHAASEALTLATAVLPDAVILDLGLPDIEDGFELLRKIRALPNGATALIVAVTGYGRRLDHRRALAAGCDFFFLKPADLDQVHDALTTIASHQRYVRSRSR